MSNTEISTVTKICTVCGDEKAITEFYVRKASKDGYKPSCKKCSDVHIKAYYKNKEYKVSSIVTKVCTVCKEEKPVAEFHKRRDSFRPACKICRKPATRIYNSSNKKKISDSCKLWRDANREKISNDKRAYRKNNKEKILAHCRNRRARKKLAGGTHTAADIINLFKLQKKKCAVCKKSIIKGYHVDHVIAIVNGGTNDKYNLQLLCAPCNLSKNDTDPIDFMQSKGMLL